MFDRSLRFGLRLASPAGARGRLSILIFHRVLAEQDPLFPGEMTQVQFNEICAWLRQWFNVLPLPEAVLALQSGTLPERALAMTFDDGYADNHDLALPVLQRHGLSAAFFVASGFLDGGRMWNDTVIESVRRTSCTEIDLRAGPAAALGSLACATVPEKQVAISRIIAASKYLLPTERELWVNAVAKAAVCDLPSNLMMTSDQLRALHRAGMVIGAHTVTHPILAQLPTAEIAWEIAEGRRQLEAILNQAVKVFAYPNGKPDKDYDQRAVDIVRQQEFLAAVSTRWGACSSQDDCFQLPRFTPWDRSRLRFGLRMLGNVSKLT